MTDASQAIERRDGSPRAMIAQYQDSFAAVLPSHITKPETWVRLAQGALKKGRRLQDGRTELEVAAANNPGVFLSTLLDAARLGLDPGTEQFYLTPRKVKGKLEILGIVGYQGHIELMYRAGAISSVVAECVYTADEFRFSPGRDDVPHHEIDWDAADRGDLRLVYAFARMKDGATSKVVVLNRAAIDKIKRSAQGADSDYSPWKTNEPAMWLKSAVRQLAKWVPTSAEYMREQLRAVRDVAAETDRPLMAVPDMPTPDSLDLDPDPGSDALDVDSWEDPGDEPGDEPGPADAADSAPREPQGDMMTGPQSRKLHALLREKKAAVGPARHAVVSEMLGRTIESTKELTFAEASYLIDQLDDTPEDVPDDEAAF